MKKIVFFIAIILIIVAQSIYMYFNYQNNVNDIKKENQEYENYLNVEINGIGLATIINKAMDSNYKNNIEKDNKGKYISNNTNSINIDIKMLDNDNTYNMESIFNGNVEIFVTYYRDIKFKCTNIEYHKETGRIKYMLFEQITK